MILLFFKFYLYNFFYLLLDFISMHKNKFIKRIFIISNFEK